MVVQILGFTRVGALTAYAVGHAVQSVMQVGTKAGRFRAVCGEVLADPAGRAPAKFDPAHPRACRMCAAAQSTVTGYTAQNAELLVGTGEMPDAQPLRPAQSSERRTAQ